MQSRDYRTLLKEIHGDSIDNWFEEPPEEDVGDNLLQYVEYEVWQDVDTGKWRFKDKQFKRRGQAQRAASEYFLKNLKG